MPLLISTLAAAPLVLASGASGWSVHTVQEHDTLWDIARQHRTDVRTLVLANQLPAGGELLRIGTAIRVPARTMPRTALGPSVRKPQHRYLVQSGDTVGDLAKRFGISPQAIITLNHLDAQARIYTGKFLMIPATAVRHLAKSVRTRAAGIQTASYLIRSGDTLSSVALSRKISLSALLKLNGLRAEAVIFPGQNLKVPRTVAPAKFSATTFAGRTYPEEVLAAAAARRIQLADQAVPGPAATQQLVASIARQYGVDPALAMAVAYQESGFNQRQVSIANAIGTMQVIPSSGDWASELIGRRLDLMKINDNIIAGVVILRALLATASSQENAIAGYYQGLGSVRRHGQYADTKRYVANIFALTRRFG